MSGLNNGSPPVSITDSEPISLNCFKISFSREREIKGETLFNG